MLLLISCLCVYRLQKFLYVILRKKINCVSFYMQASWLYLDTKYFKVVTCKMINREAEGNIP